MIVESGQMGAVTVATSMAGRGTDIKLGKGVAELGGLVVIGTERMERQRIDLQIRGRSGRQGDPGMSKFFVSLEDDVIKKYGPSWVHRTYKEYAINDHIEPKELTGRKYRKLVEMCIRDRVNGGLAVFMNTILLISGTFFLVWLSDLNSLFGIGGSLSLIHI